MPGKHKIGFNYFYQNLIYLTLIDNTYELLEIELYTITL